MVISLTNLRFLMAVDQLLETSVLLLTGLKLHILVCIYAMLKPSCCL